jgi:hypothetical protein
MTDAAVTDATGAGTPGATNGTDPARSGGEHPGGEQPASRRAAAWALPARDFVAIALAGVGTLLLFISLLVSWEQINIVGSDGDVRVAVGVGDIPTWGTAYVVGGMLLVALFVGVVVLPLQLGRAARILGIAWAITIAGVVTATAVRLAQRPADLMFGLTGGYLTQAGQTGGMTMSWGPGIWLAAGALVAMAAAFAAACPPLRDSDDKLSA